MLLKLYTPNPKTLNPTGRWLAEDRPVRFETPGVKTTQGKDQLM